LKTLDVAKRLLDTASTRRRSTSRLIVSGAIMIEPTESESRETLDEFVAAMKKILKEAREQPELVKTRRTTRGVSRLDEVRAARQPRLRWRRPA